MVTWSVVPASQAAERWDGWLMGFRDRHFRQCSAWARHKSAGWETLHTALFNGADPMALGLCLVRPAPLGAATLAWVNGGPVYVKDRPAHYNLDALEKYLEGLKSHLAGLPRPVLRLNIGWSAEIEAQLVLRKAGFVRPLTPLNTDLTYIVDLEKSLEELHAGLERNWRNQLRSAEKADPEVTIGRDRAILERYLPLHNALCERKTLGAQRLTLGDLERMVGDLKEQIVFLMISAEGKDGCGGALWTFGGKAYFALSAANEWGLKRNLPNLLYWRAIAHLKECGVREFDLTGIDPAGSWGVFNFKRGLKARPVELQGEWDWSPSPWRRRGFNLALWALRGRLA